MYVCVWPQGEYSELYASKTNKNRNTQFCTEYQTSAYMTFPGFEENWKRGSGLEETGN